MFDVTEEDLIELIKDFDPDDEFETTLQYGRTDISEGIDIHKTNAPKVCMLRNYWYFKDVNVNLNNVFVINVVLNVSFQNQKELK